MHTRGECAAVGHRGAASVHSHPVSVVVSVILEAHLPGMQWHLHGCVPPSAFEKCGRSSNQSAEVNKLSC